MPNPKNANFLKNSRKIRSSSTEKVVIGSQQYNRILFENCPIGLAIYRMDGTPIDVNSAFAALIGRAVEETLTLNYWEITPEKYKALEKSYLNSLENSRESKFYEKEYIHKQGHLVAVRSRGTILEIEGERLIYSTVEKLDARSGVEAEIGKNYSLLQAIAEETGDAIFVKDIQGRYVTINSAFARNLGKPIEEIIGKNDAELWTPDLARHFQEGDRKVMDAGISQTVEEVVPGINFVRTFLVTKSLWRDKEGNVCGLIGIAREITERKQAEEALRRSEARLQLALEASHNGMWEWNIATDEVYFSPNFLRMSGYSEGDLEENVNGWTNLLHPDDLPKAMEEVTAHLEGRRSSYQAEFRIRTKSGEWQWILDAAKIVERDENGKPLRMIGTHRDISDRKQIEEALIKERDFSKTIIEACPAFIAIIGADGKTLTLNPAMLNALGYTLEEVAGKDYVQTFVPETESATLYPIFERVVTSRQPSVHFNPVIAKDGSLRICEWHFQAILKNNGEVDFFIGVGIDISDRLALEKELALRQARFDAFFSLAPAGLGIVDEALKVVQINEALADINGVSVADHLGKTIGEILPSMASILEPMYRRILTAGEAFLNIEISGITAKQPGVERHWMASYFPLPGADGKPIAAGVVAVEISDRKRAEAQLRQYQEGLEDLVAERTAELTAANQQLQEKIAELERAEATLRLQGQILSQIHDAVITTDISGIVISWNKGAERLYGYSATEALGQTIGFLYPAEELHRLQSEVFEPLLAKGSHEVEVRSRRSSGEIIDVHLSLSLLHDIDGEFSGVIGYSTDITYRVQAQQELQRSYNLLHSVMESASDPVFVKDRQGRYTMINSAAASVFGKSIDEIIGKDDIEIWPEIAAYIRETDLRIMTAGVAEAVEEIIFSQQQRKTYLSTKSPWRDLDGNVIGLIGISRDISDRKRAEEELQRSYNLLHSVMESTPDSIFVKDLEGKFVLVNSTVAKGLGLPVEEIIGKEDSYWLPPDIARQMKENDRAIIATGVPVTIEEDIMTAGEKATYLSVKSPWRDVEGNIVGIVCIARNISDRKRAEEALQRSEQTLRQQAMREALLNQLARQIRTSLDLDTILQTAVQEIQNLLRIDACNFSWYRPHVNPPMCDVVYEARYAAFPSVLGTYPIDLMSPIIQQLLQLQIIRLDDIDALSDESVRQSYAAVGIASALVVPIQTQSGDIGIISCNCYREMRRWSDAEVELLQAIADQVAIAIDQARLYEQTRTKAQELEEILRELRSTQAQLIQSEKMSSLGQLVAGVAHEINNPVNFIYGNLTHAKDYTQDLLRLLQLYQETYPNSTPEIIEEIEAIELDFLSEDLPKLLSSMKVGAERIREIVLSLRTFSRLDEAEMKEVDLHDGIESTLLILQNRTKAKPDRPAIEVIKNFGNLPLVECYPGQLNQVFMNVLANALDALETQPAPCVITISTEVKSEKVGSASTLVPCSAIVRIADNGPGMTEQVRQRLFDPFFTTKPTGKGTGLGLAISHSIIVEKHKGSLRCNSAPGEGAEFIIEIPLRQQAPRTV